MSSKMPDTSLAAGRLFTDDMKNTHYKKIIGALKVLGVANYETISKFLGMIDRNQISRRMKEMEGLGLVFKPTSKSPTSSGRMAYNYQLTGTQPTTEIQEKNLYKSKETTATEHASKIIQLSLI